ncbi:Aldo-keto reductase YhdN [subsurface metagenome]
MRYSYLESLNIRPSHIGFGCWPLGGHGWGKVSEAEMVKAVHRALDLDVNIFDTAPIYGLGHSEEVLGKTLGTKRGKVIIATKVGLTWKKGKTFEKITDSSPANINREIDDSLKRLKTDYIDLYQIHWPDPNTPIEETMSAMERLKRAGKIRCIGCCNFSLELLKEALKYGQIKAVQIPYNLIDREVEKNLLPFCWENGIGVLTYSSIAQGLLSGKYNENTRFTPDDYRSKYKYFQGEAFLRNLTVLEKVKKVARKVNRSPVQIALRWVLQNPSVATALVGVKNPAQVEQNVLASDFVLPEEDMKFLNEEVTCF